MGVGSALAQASLLLMVGQYFKKNRERVEVLVEASTGLGAIMAGCNELLVH